MDVLVLGGSYFLGKHFVELAKNDHSVTIFNRGSRPIKLPKVTEIFGERHSVQDISKIPRQHFDVVVDFCAYEKGDIEFIFENLNADFDQYVFISTCDVYERGLDKVLDEDAPFESRDFGGEAGSYISGKVALEKEVEQCSKQYNKSYTSIRLAFIYGPYNYAPREGIYFHWIKNAGQIIHPEDADGQFQMVYVEDAAKAVLNAIKNENAYNKAFNIAPLPMITYDIFADELKKAVDIEFTKVPVSVQDILDKQIPLPFPLTRQESNFYSSSENMLVESYTSLCDGLKKTYEWYKDNSTI